METAFYTINNIPYGTDTESLFLSPNDILVPNYQLDSLAAAEIQLANVNLFIKKMRAYHEEKNKILEETFLTDWRGFRPGQLKLKESKKGITTDVGDLVLIRADNLCGPGRYGVVDEIISPQTLKLRLCGGNEIERPVNLVIPLVVNCLLNWNSHAALKYLVIISYLSYIWDFSESK